SMRTIPVAESILDRHTISLDHYRSEDGQATRGWGGTGPVPGYAVDVVDGHTYPSFPWTISLFAIPVVAAVDGAHAVGLGPGIEARSRALNSDWEFEVLAMSLLMAVATVVIYAIASTLLEGRRRAALLV